MIEDDFAAGRPAWERAGAIITADVRPYEQIKLRLLNGAHSTLAYLAVLADCELVSDAVGPDAPFRAVLTRLMAVDVAPTLAVPDGFDLAAYQDELLERFANPALRHRTIQIAMDGSQKLPMRLLGTIRDRRRAGAEPVVASLGVAAWMRFVSAPALRRRARAHRRRPAGRRDRRAAARARGRRRPSSTRCCRWARSSTTELAGDAAWRGLLIDHLDALIRDGARAHRPPPERLRSQCRPCPSASPSPHSSRSPASWPSCAAPSDRHLEACRARWARPGSRAWS